MGTQLETTAPTPMVLIDKAISSGIDPDKLGRLMDLQERWEKNRAAEAYGLAITRFQQKCPVVMKQNTAMIKARTGPDWSYKFASYDDIMGVIGPLLTEENINLGFSATSPGPGLLEVTMRIRVGIHVEESKLTIPIPTNMLVSEPQKFGAALTFAKRYVLCAGFNIVLGDEDVDGAGLSDTINKEQQGVLLDMICEAGADQARWLKWLEAESIDKIPVTKYELARVELQRKINAKKGSK